MRQLREAVYEQPNIGGQQLARVASPRSSSLALRKFLSALPLSLALLSSLGCQKSSAPVEVVRPVRLQMVSLSDSQQDNRYAGEIKPRHESALGFRVGGKIFHRIVNVGDRVVSGQVLAQLDPADLSLSAASSRAAVAAQQAQVDIDKADLHRAQQLFTDGYVGQADLERQKAKTDAAQAQLDALHAQQAVSANQSAYAELRADHDGTITQVLAEAGQVVAAGQPVMALAWNGEKEVAISIPEDGVTQIHVGMPVKVTLWTQPGHEFGGTVRELAASADPATRTYPVRISVPSASEAMRLGMSAVVWVPHQDEGVAGGVVRIPLAALTEQAAQKGVWLYDAKQGQVHFTPVQVSGVNGDDVLIAAGLADGDAVVTAGAAFLQSGQKVRPLTPQSSGQSSAQPLSQSSTQPAPPASAPLSVPQSAPLAAPASPPQPGVDTRPSKL